MRVIKKINNNVALCVDHSGREVIAMGKGLGFGQIPREVPLREIERTFYDIDAAGRGAFRDMPDNVLLFSARVIDAAANKLPYELSPNAVVLLADHIAFILERHKKRMNVRMPLAYDVQQTYPAEYELAREVVRQIRWEFNLGVSDDETAGIALNLANSREETQPQESVGSDADMLEEITRIVEKHFNIQVEREGFNYSRFATHLQYLFQRVHQCKSIDSENYPDV